jgi:hypothetical protein
MEHLPRVHEQLDELLESNRRDWACLGQGVMDQDERRTLLASIRERSFLFWELRERQRIMQRRH